MKSALAINDPLSEQEVKIVITVPSSELLRDERPILLSVGLDQQMPIVKNGDFGGLLLLIKQSWDELGIRAELNAQTHPQENAASAQLIATTSVDDDSKPEPAKIKPPTNNLSLF